MNKFRSKDVSCYILNEVNNNENNLILNDFIYNDIVSSPTYQKDFWISLKSIIRIIRKETKDKVYLHSIDSYINVEKGIWLNIHCENKNGTEYHLHLRFVGVDMEMTRDE